MTLSWLINKSDYVDITLVRDDGDFNWSRLCNLVVQHTSGDVLIMLNNDIEVMTQDWLEQCLAELNREDVGIVGPLLTYPNGKIQHAGVVLGFGGAADHLFSGCPPNASPCVFSLPTVKRSVLALTGACQVFRREVYDAVGGFDEDYVVAGDVDFSIRVWLMGLRNLYLPDVMLLHRESMSRGTGLPAGDREKIGRLLKQLPEGRDPYFHPELSLKSLWPMLRLTR